MRSNTLLTGILKCHKCGGNLKISTGKGGKYSYYKCSNRINHGVDYCDCPPVRSTKLDKLIIEGFLSEVLNEKVIEEILGEIKDNLSLITKNDKIDLLSASRNLINNNLKINKLYELLSEGTIQADETLTSHLDNLKNERILLKTKIEELKSRTKLPLKKFGKLQIRAFINAAKNIFMGKNKESAKQLLLQLVDKIEVSDSEIKTSGTKFSLIELVSQTKMGTSSEVPIFVTMWR